MEVRKADTGELARGAKRKAGKAGPFAWPDWANGSVEVLAGPDTWVEAESLEQTGNELLCVFEHDGDTKSTGFPPHQVRNPDTQELAGPGLGVRG